MYRELADDLSKIYTQSPIKKLLNIFYAMVLRHKKRTIEDFAQYVNGKTVAIVGNAASLLDKNLGKEIDEAEIVIRLNLGIVSTQSSQGSRCDVLGISLPLDSEKVDRLFSPKYIIWLTPRTKHFSLRRRHHLMNTVIYPKFLWKKEFKKLNARPSSGYMVISFLTEILKPKSIKVYGFDFAKSSSLTSPTRTKKAPHDFEKEKLIIQEKARNGTLEICE